MEYFRTMDIMATGNLGKAIAQVRNTYLFLYFIFSYSSKVIGGSMFKFNGISGKTEI